MEFLIILMIIYCLISKVKLKYNLHKNVSIYYILELIMKHFVHIASCNIILVPSGINY
jgi:hypothetical protein